MISKHSFLKIIALTLVVTFTFTNSVGYTDLPSSFSTILKNSEIYHVRANAEFNSGLVNVRSELRKAGIDIPERLEIPDDEISGRTSNLEPRTSGGLTTSEVRRPKSENRSELRNADPRLSWSDRPVRLVAVGFVSAAAVMIDASRHELSRPAADFNGAMLTSLFILVGTMALAVTYQSAKSLFSRRSELRAIAINEGNNGSGRIELIRHELQGIDRQLAQLRLSDAHILELERSKSESARNALSSEFQSASAAMLAQIDGQRKIRELLSRQAALSAELSQLEVSASGADKQLREQHVQLIAEKLYESVKQFQDEIGKNDRLASFRDRLIAFSMHGKIRRAITISIMQYQEAPVVFRPILFLLFFIGKPVIRWIASRFIVADKSFEKVIPILEARLKQGIGFSLDLVGDKANTKEGADHYFRTILKELTVFGTEREVLRQAHPAVYAKTPPIHISLKLRALVYNFGEKTKTEAKEKLKAILQAAKTADAFVRIDAEEFEFRQIMLDVYKEVVDGNEDLVHLDQEGRLRLGLVVQAYFRDAQEAVLENLRAWGAQHHYKVPVRLVKGAYYDYEKSQGSPMFEYKESTDANYENAAEFILSHADVFTPAFGTHNLRSIAKIIALSEVFKISKEDIEFQMLNGMGEPIKRALVAMGFRFRDYVPYGDLINGLGYLTRRLVENTSQQSFLVGLLTGAMSIKKIEEAPQFRGSDSRSELRNHETSQTDIDRSGVRVLTEGEGRAAPSALDWTKVAEGAAGLQDPSTSSSVKSELRVDEADVRMSEEFTIQLPSGQKVKATLVARYGEEAVDLTLSSTDQIAIQPGPYQLSGKVEGQLPNITQTGNVTSVTSLRPFYSIQIGSSNTFLTLNMVDGEGAVFQLDGATFPRSELRKGDWSSPDESVDFNARRKRAKLGIVVSSAALVALVAAYIYLSSDELDESLLTAKRAAFQLQHLATSEQPVTTAPTKSTTRLSDDEIENHPKTLALLEKLRSFDPSVSVKVQFTGSRYLRFDLTKPVPEDLESSIKDLIDAASKEFRMAVLMSVQLKSRSELRAISEDADVGSTKDEILVRYLAPKTLLGNFDGVNVFAEVLRVAWSTKGDVLEAYFSTTTAEGPKGRFETLKAYDMVQEGDPEYVELRLKGKLIGTVRWHKREHNQHFRSGDIFFKKSSPSSHSTKSELRNVARRATIEGVASMAGVGILAYYALPAIGVTAFWPVLLAMAVTIVAVGVIRIPQLEEQEKSRAEVEEFERGMAEGRSSRWKRDRELRSELRAETDEERFKRFGISFQGESVDFKNVPANASWAMNDVRPIEISPIVFESAKFPNAPLLMDLDRMPLFSEGGDDNAKIYLGIAHIDNSNVPVVVKMFSDKFMEKEANVQNELEKAQVLDRLGTHPKFYGVVRNKQGGIIGYAMQLVIGEFANPNSNARTNPEWSTILERFNSIGLELPHVIQTRAGHLVTLDAGNAHTEALNSDAETAYHLFLVKLGGKVSRSRAELRATQASSKDKDLSLRAVSKTRRSNLSSQIASAINQAPRNDLFSPDQFDSLGDAVGEKERIQLAAFVQAAVAKIQFPNYDDITRNVSFFDYFARSKADVVLGSILTQDLILAESDSEKGQEVLWALPIIVANVSDPIAFVVDSASEAAIRDVLKGISIDHVVFAESYPDAHRQLIEKGAKETRIIASEREHGFFERLGERYESKVVYVARKNVQALFRAFGIQEITEGLTTQLRGNLAALRSA